MSRLQTLLSVLLAWCAVPATLFLFWGRYIPRHDWLGTGIHIALLVASIGYGFLSYWFARATLRGEDWEPIDWKYDGAKRIYKRGAVAIFTFIFFSALSLGAINGDPSDKGTGIWTMVPKAFESIRWRTYADFEEVDVSTKPDNWTGGNGKEIGLVRGARLMNRDLRFASAYRAFLVKADLRNADFRWADLRGANLKDAKLQWSSLYRTKLQEANLQGANLWDVDLQEANLRGARNLTPSQIKRANNWVLTYYDNDLLSELGLPLDHNEKVERKNLSRAKLEGANLRWSELDDFNLQEANLRDAKLQGAYLFGANLQGANLQKANLQKANLREADLLEADLQGANLRKAKNLTAFQVKEAVNWQLAFYDREFLKELDLPPDHNETLQDKLAKLEKKEKAAAGKK